ncbi:MAG: right-handed parallel beta-helix repeat-containing protein, partial [Desulfosarcinaceae bacterium]
FFLAILIADAATVAAECGCPPLGSPSAGETVVNASTLADLQDCISQASGPTTIYLEDGIYSVTTDSFVNVYRDEVTIRSRSGDRTAVIIEGQGMAAAGQYGHGIYVAADKVTIADLTVRQTQHHGIFVTPGSDDCRIYNVVVIDTGEQLIKASGGTDQAPKSGGSVACSWIGYTDTLDDDDDGWYTNGIDLLNSHGWTLRNNTFRNIRHHPGLTSQLAGPAILVWQGSADTKVEGNRFIDCDRGIAFGDSSGSGVQHTGGEIRNNTIKGYSGSDVGIGVVRATNALVEHNTVYAPGGVYDYSIEADQPETTGGIIRNNFTDEPILADRRGASVAVSNNHCDAQVEDFVDAGNGDLHLVAAATHAIDAGAAVDGRSYDLDCEEISDGAPDLGADEWRAVADDSPDDPTDPVPDPTPGGGGSGHGSGCFINAASASVSRQADAQNDSLLPAQKG